MNEAGILYVKANGSDSSDCSHQLPCSLYRAINLALAASPGPTIRLLPGLYASAITVSTANPVPLKFVGTGAALAAQTAISVQDGAQVDIRGISAAGTSMSVHCASTTSTRSSLTLRDAHITAGDGGATLMYLEKCTLVMTGGELDIGASTGASVQMLADVGFSADRVHVHGTRVSLIGASLATRIAVKITNSLLEDVSFQWQTNDTSSPGSAVSMGFNTMILKNQLNCATNSGSAYRKSTYENNIIVSIDPTSAVNGTDCTLGHNLLFPYSGTAGTNIVADPQFQDAANGDFRLQATSPAVDSAVPSAVFPATTDYAGNSRPQGAQPDIGAFERTP